MRTQTALRLPHGNDNDCPNYMPNSYWASQLGLLILSNRCLIASSKTAHKIITHQSEMSTHINAGLSLVNMDYEQRWIVYQSNSSHYYSYYRLFTSPKIYSHSIFTLSKLRPALTHITFMAKTTILPTRNSYTFTAPDNSHGYTAAHYDVKRKFIRTNNK